MIAAFYLLLALTGVFAFQQLEDLYTLNFVPNRCPNARTDTITLIDQVLPKGMLIPNIMEIKFAWIYVYKCVLYFKDIAGIGQQVVQYFLALFPVFTLTTSFPVITITLRNNLKQLFLGRDDSEYSFFVRRLFFPLLALIPPVFVAFVTSDVQFLVGITGSYAGAGVQYVVPAFLAFYSRRELIKEFGSVPVHNSFASPFQHVAFIIFVLLWAVACIAFVTYNHVVSG